MTQTLRDLATEQLDVFAKEYGPPNDRDQAILRWMRYLVSSGRVPDDTLKVMPEVSRHNEPQDNPQEYECGCVVITRITDRDTRHNECPFEMRLALPCDSNVCELAHLRSDAWRSR